MGGLSQSDAAKQNAKSVAETNIRNQAQQATKSGSVQASGNSFGNGRVTFDSKGNRYVNGQLTNLANESDVNSLSSLQQGKPITSQQYQSLEQTGILGYGGRAVVGESSQAYQPVIVQGDKRRQASLTENIGISDKVNTSNPNTETLRASTVPLSSPSKDSTIAFSSKTSKAIPFSQGSEYGWKNLGQNDLVRNSKEESQAIQNEQNKASKIYPNYENADYFTGGTPTRSPFGTTGGVQTRVSKELQSQTSFGWNGSQNVRNSKAESAKETSEAIRALSNTKNDENQVYNLWGIKANKQQNGGVPIGNNSFAQKNPSGKGTQYEIDFNENVGIGESLQGNTKGQNNFNESQQRSFADYISNYGKEGATINLLSGGQVVASVKGPNAYREAVQISQNYPKGISAEVIPSTTRESKDLIDNLVSGARNVGATSIDIFDTGKGKNKGTIIESIPINDASKILPLKIDQYATNQNIALGYNPKQIQTPKDTTLTPASVTPIDITDQASKSFTGNYFNLSQWFEKESARYTGYSNPLMYLEGKQPDYPRESGLSKPVTTPSDQIKIGGLSTSFPTKAIEEGGQNFLARIGGGIKSTYPLFTGLEAEAYNTIKTGKSSFFNVNPASLTTIGNTLGEKVIEPQNSLSPFALQSMQLASNVQHNTIGKPLNNAGVGLPQVVQNPLTVGAEVGSLVAFGVMAAPVVKGLPFRLGGEAGTYEIPIGSASKGPLASSEPLIESGQYQIKGLVAGYGGKGTLMLYGRSRVIQTARNPETGELETVSSKADKPYIFSNLKPRVNPETGQANLGLNNFYATAERGSPFAESTKLTLSKLANKDAGEVFANIKDESGRPKFSQSEFDLILKAQNANKYYNKIPNQKVSESQSNKYFAMTGITKNPELTVSTKQVAQSVQSRYGAFSGLLSSLGKGDTKTASAYGTFVRSPLPAAKGSPIVAGQIAEFNLQSEGKGFVSQPPLENVKDIDIEITNSNQPNSLVTILNTKVKRPEGYSFGKQESGTNIFYGKTGEQGKEVFNLLSDKDVNPNDLSASSGKVFGEKYSTKTSRLGNFKTKTMGFQARALTNSLSTVQSRELVEANKGTTEPSVYSGVMGRFDKSQQILTAFTPRVGKDLSRNTAVLEYGARRTSGKASKAFSDYRTALLEAHPYVKLENISGEEFIQSLNEAKTSSKQTGSKSSLLNNSARNSFFTTKPSNQTPSSRTSRKSALSSYSIASSRSPSSIMSKLVFSSPSSRNSPSSKSTLSNFSSISPRSTKSTKSISSPKSPLSTLSPKSPLSPSSPKSPNSNSILSISIPSPTSPTSSSSSGSSGSPGSPGSPRSFYPLSPIPNNSFIPFYPTTTKTIPLPKLGNVGKKRKYKNPEGFTNIFGFNIKNPFASGLNIYDKNNRNWI